MFDVMVGEGTNVEALVGVTFDVMIGRVRTLRHLVESCLTLWLGGYERGQWWCRVVYLFLLGGAVPARTHVPILLSTTLKKL